jgi:hypothetical protein
MKQDQNYRPLTYFLIEAGKPILRVQKFFCKYDTALRKARGLNCIVTNGPWLISRGLPLQIATHPEKPHVVQSVRLNNVPIARA